MLQFCGLQLVCFIFGLMLAALLRQGGFAAFRTPDGFGAVLLSTLGFQGATCVLASIFLWQHQIPWREAVGWQRQRTKSFVLWTVGVFVAVLPIAWVLQGLSNLALTRLGFPPESQHAVELFLNAKSLWFRIYLGFFAVVLAPVAEEFIFRGVLYPFVKQAGFPRYAFFGVNAVFALIHLDAGALVPLFVLALALTWLYEQTDSLLAPIIAHSLFNTANLVLLLLVELFGAGLPAKS